MRKITKILCTSILLLTVLWLADVVKDRQVLSRDLIRLHVVADSDSDSDQQIKLLVRDRITAYLQGEMTSQVSTEEAKAYLQAHLPQLEAEANAVLEEAGVMDRARVTLTREAFPQRHYDTFSLPAGVYESLRITIGQGEGKNWWCVIFPSLCLPAAGEDMADTAAGAGFDDALTGSLQGEKTYQVRFFLLDCFGWLQNFFCPG